ncbi:MAG: hypothetical protein JWM57_688 [Phycisphaerales bacterium]|nr:hypothetical protein [Phycisphaerales bacterium]
MKASTSGPIRVGISGWTYEPWRGTFYPEKLVQRLELQYAAEHLSTIEINGTFYGLQKPPSFEKWYEQTPADFMFSVKAPQFITHRRRLRDVQVPIANFLLSGVLRLSEKLGPILWQFPPNFKLDETLFETFLGQLPHSTKDAAAMAKLCEPRMKGRMFADIDKDRPLRHAVEIRHESFATEAFVKLLRKHGVALVIADTGGKWPALHDITADFAYLRLHGPEEIYESGYTETGLKSWAKQIRAIAQGTDAPGGHRIGPPAAKRAKRDVFVYFDNTLKVKSPADAMRLAEILG